MPPPQRRPVPFWGTFSSSPQSGYGIMVIQEPPAPCPPRPPFARKEHRYVPQEEAVFPAGNSLLRHAAGHGRDLRADSGAGEAIHRQLRELHHRKSAAGDQFCGPRLFQRRGYAASAHAQRAGGQHADPPAALLRQRHLQLQLPLAGRSGAAADQHHPELHVLRRVRGHLHAGLQARRLRRLRLPLDG